VRKDDTKEDAAAVIIQTSTQTSSRNLVYFPAAAQGERWRRFLERVGTRSNDFAARLSRARFVYLHRRDNATHWLPL
jgi:hypothetical protein